MRSRIRGSFHSLLFTPLLLVAKECSAALGVQEVGPHPGCFCDWLGHISLEELSSDWEVQLSGKAAGQWGRRPVPEGNARGWHPQRDCMGWEREVSFQGICPPVAVSFPHD